MSSDEFGVIRMRHFAPVIGLDPQDRYWCHLYLQLLDRISGCAPPPILLPIRLNGGLQPAVAIRLYTFA